MKKTDKYIDFLILSGKGESYQNAAKGAINIFKKYTGQSAARMNPSNIKKFVIRATELATDERKKHTIAQRYQMLKQIALYFENVKALKMLNTIDIKGRLKTEKPGPLTDNWKSKALSRTDIQNVLAAIPTRQTWIKPIVMLYITTGARLNELTHLKFGDIAEDFSNIIVLGKGNKRRRIELTNPTAREALKKYAQCRSCVSLDSFVFQSQKIGCPHVSNRAVQYQIKRIFKALNIDVPGRNVHCFRHTFITEKINSGVPPHIVAEAAGHASVDTTLKHYLHLDRKKVREELMTAPELF